MYLLVCASGRISWCGFRMERPLSVDAKGKRQESSGGGRVTRSLWKRVMLAISLRQRNDDVHNYEAWWYPVPRSSLENNQMSIAKISVVTIIQVWSFFFFCCWFSFKHFCLKKKTQIPSITSKTVEILLRRIFHEKCTGLFQAVFFFFFFSC